jgi:uncharacterized membrane protein YkgB
VGYDIDLCRRYAEHDRHQFLRPENVLGGILGAIGSTITFVMTVTIIPFMPNGWDPAAGFPAMARNVPFLMKDVVLLAASIYLLKQDMMRLSLYEKQETGAALLSR